MMNVQQTTVRQIEIPKATLEQQQSINEKIIKYQKFNKEFNKRYYDEKRNNMKQSGIEQSKKNLRNNVLRLNTMKPYLN